MITDAVVGWVLGAITAVFGLVPSWTPATFDTPPTWLGYAMNFDRILPIGLMLTLVLATVVMYGLMQLFDLGFKVYHQFWGSD